MIIIDDNSNVNFKSETYIALGSFDGLHLGHMSLVNKAIELARKNACDSMVYTFKNHPLTVINSNLAPKLLIDNCTKIEILETSSLDAISLVKFDEQLMKMSPEDFAYHIKSKYNMRGAVVGFNYRFGFKNEGDVNLLRNLGEKFDFDVYVMDGLEFDGEIVSSSRIRRFIQDGKIEAANVMLSRPFGIRGTVISGKKLGRQLGFPTANVSINGDFVYPKVGVYYTNVVINNAVYKGISNVGFNPTVDGTSLSFETHILDFSCDIYGEDIMVYFIERIRDEIKFNSKQELINQMNTDKEYAVSKKLELNFKK